MQDEDDGPTLARGVLRVGTLFVVVAVIAYLLWDLYSESAALGRLSATAAKFTYTERCDAAGNPIAAGQPNCVDLNHYLFVYGPVSKAFRRACTGKPAEMLLFEEGRVARTEINRVEKMLKFRAKYGENPPC